MDQGIYFKTILINQREFGKNRKIDKALYRLLMELLEYEVNFIYLNKYNLNKIKVQNFFREIKMKPEQCLLFSTKDKTIDYFSDENIVLIGCFNGARNHQQLSNADIIIEGFEEVGIDFLNRVYQRKHNIPWIIFETERCRVREMIPEDLQDLYEIYSDQHVTEFVENLYENPEDELDYMISYIENMYGFYGFGIWIIEDIDSGRMIGRAGLELMEEQEMPLLEMGYVIRKEYRNKGYAYEVCEKIIKFAKENTEFEEIFCFIQKENAISIHLIEKLGFTLLDQGCANGKTMQRYRKKLHF